MHPELATDHLLLDLKNRTIVSGLVTAGAQAIEFVLYMAAMIGLARLLTPEDFGLVAMVMTIMGFLAILREGGLSTATIQHEDLTYAQVSNLFWMNVAISGCLSAAVAGGAPLLAWFYREPRLVTIALVLSVTFLLNGLVGQHLALLNRQMRFKTIAVVRLGSVCAGIVIGLGMALLKCGYWSLVGLQLVAPLAAVLLTGWVSRWRPRGPSRSSQTRPLFSFGATVSVSAFIYALSRGIDGLLIGRFCGPGPLGFYSRAIALVVRPVDQFVAPIGTVFVPALSRLHAYPERYRRIFLQLHDAIVLGACVLSGILVTIARPLTLVVLGARWEPVAGIVAALAIAALFLPVFSASSWLFASQGRGGDWLLASSLVSLLTMCAFISGLPYGPVGVAAAYSVSGVLIGLPIVYQIAGRRGPVRTKDLWIGFLRHLPIWGVVVSVMWVVLGVIGESAPLLQLLICVPVGLTSGVTATIMCPSTRATAANLFQAMWSLVHPHAVKS